MKCEARTRTCGSNRPTGLADGLEVGVLYRPPSRGQTCGASARRMRPVARVSRRWVPRGAVVGALGVQLNLRLSIVVVKRRNVPD